MSNTLRQAEGGGGPPSKLASDPTFAALTRSRGCQPFCRSMRPLASQDQEPDQRRRGSGSRIRRLEGATTCRCQLESFERTREPPSPHGATGSSPRPGAAPLSPYTPYDRIPWFEFQSNQIQIAFTLRAGDCNEEHTTTPRKPRSICGSCPHRGQPRARPGEWHCRSQVVHRSTHRA